MANAFGPNLPRVKSLLEENGAPMSIADMIEASGIPSRSKTPGYSVSRDLSLSMRDDPQSPFIRLRRGVYGLAKWYEDSIEGHE